MTPRPRSVVRWNDGTESELKTIAPSLEAQVALLQQRLKTAERERAAILKECRRIHSNGEWWAKRYAYQVLGKLLETYGDGS